MHCLIPQCSYGIFTRISLHYTVNVENINVPYMEHWGYAKGEGSAQFWKLTETQSLTRLFFRVLMYVLSSDGYTLHSNCFGGYVNDYLEYYMRYRRLNNI